MSKLKDRRRHYFLFFIDAEILALGAHFVTILFAVPHIAISDQVNQKTKAKTKNEIKNIK